MQALLETIAAEVRPLAADGRPARYIPALAEVDPKLFA
ncbi:MAG: glutaminase, partial [Pseudomonadota bacterium]